jgi:hypothetical protein
MNPFLFPHSSFLFFPQNRAYYSFFYVKKSVRIWKYRGGYTIMKRKYLFMTGVLALALTFGFTLAACGDGDDGGSTPNIASFSGIWNASGGRTIVFTGNTFVYTGNGTSYSGTFSVSGSTITFTVSQGTATATFQLSGNTLDISGHSQDTSVNGTYTKDSGGGNITYDVAATGSPDTTALNFTFETSVSGLLASDITITDGSGSATKGNLTGSGTSWSLGVTAGTAGTVTVSINKTGIQNGGKTVNIVKGSDNGGITVPGVPTNVVASAQSSSSIQITWNAPSSGGAPGSYIIYRSSSSTGNYSQVGTSNTTSYTDIDLTASTTYYYKVAAQNSAGTGTQSSSVSAKTNSTNPFVGIWYYENEWLDEYSYEITFTDNTWTQTYSYGSEPDCAGTYTYDGNAAVLEYEGETIAMAVFYGSVVILTIEWDYGYGDKSTHRLTKDNSAGGPNSKTMEITGITDTMLNNASEFWFLGVFTQGASVADAKAVIKAIYAEEPFGNKIVAGTFSVDEFSITPSMGGQPPYTLTVQLKDAASDFETHWTGTGTYDLWFISLTKTNYYAYNMKDVSITGNLTSVPTTGTVVESGTAQSLFE